MYLKIKNKQNEAFVEAIASNKFNKKYYPKTTLLVVLDAISDITRMQFTNS